MKREPIANLRPQELINLAKFCQAALIILNARALTLLSMLLSAAAFGYVLWQPDWIRAFGACAFALLVFWPLQRAESHKETTQGETNDQS